MGILRVNLLPFPKKEHVTVILKWFDYRKIREIILDNSIILLHQKNAEKNKGKKNVSLLVQNVHLITVKRVLYLWNRFVNSAPNRKK